MYQHVERDYQGKCVARTPWKVQYKVGEEYILNYDQLLLGINTFAREPPKDDLDNLKRIEIPRYREKEGHPGAVNGRR